MHRFNFTIVIFNNSIAKLNDSEKMLIIRKAVLNLQIGYSITGLFTLTEDQTVTTGGSPPLNSEETDTTRFVSDFMTVGRKTEGNGYKHSNECNFTNQLCIATM